MLKSKDTEQIHSCLLALRMINVDTVCRFIDALMDDSAGEAEPIFIQQSDLLPFVEVSTDVVKTASTGLVVMMNAPKPDRAFAGAFYYQTFLWIRRLPDIQLHDLAVFLSQEPMGPQPNHQK